MAITATPYGQFLLNVGKARFDFTSDTVKVSLHDSSYTPDVDVDAAYSDVSSSQISGTGYTSGGAALSSMTWTYDTANNWALLGAADTVWTTATFTCRYAVVYKDSGSPSTSYLVGYVDFGANQSPAAEDFTMTWSSGALRLRIV